MTEAKGGCLCGSVTFKAKFDDLTVNTCHCSQCRRWSGHQWASVDVNISAMEIADDAGALAWFRSSDYARRGFCKLCGSSLFWHADKLDGHKDTIAIAAGTVTEPSQLTLTSHIFTDDQGDYYDIADGLPQKKQY